MEKDIFISYRNDGEGNNFAARLKADLDRCGYNCYFNSDEQRTGAFPEQIRQAIENCRDFILILSKGCINGLIGNSKIN